MASNIGSQSISVKYNDPVDSDIVNSRFFDTKAIGIYKGGWLTYSGTTVTISPIVCEIKDRGGDTNQIRVQTAAAVSVTSMSSLTPYIVARWDHELSASSDYVTFTQAAAPEETDVVIGKAIFTGLNVTSIDYSKRTFANNRGSFLQVAPAYPTPSVTEVYVMPGVIALQSAVSGYLAINEQKVTISSGTTVYVYVDTVTGTVSTTTDVLTAARQIILAKVVRDGVTGITEKDITDLRQIVAGPVLVDNATVQKDANNRLKVVDNVYVKRTGDETVAGTKTFSSSPLVPTAAARDSSTKAASTAFVQNASNNADSYWTVTIADANNYTTPAQFTTSIASFSMPSRGSIIINAWQGYQPFYNNSSLFTMRVYCKTTTTKTLKSFSVDNYAYFYQDSTLLGSVVGAWTSETPYTVTYNFVAGNTYTVQVVFADQGAVYYLSAIGDLIDNVNTFYSAS